MCQPGPVPVLVSRTIRAERLRKRYRRGPAVLAGVDVALEPGAPIVLAGANGSGKSTLLRLVAGASAPTGGRVVGRPRVVGYLPDRFPAMLLALTLAVGAASVSAAVGRRA